MFFGCRHFLAMFYVIWHRTNYLFVFITKVPLTDACVPSPGMDYLLAGPEDPETGRLLVTLQSVVALWTPRLGLNLSKGLRHECPWATILNHKQRWWLSTWSYGISGQYRDAKTSRRSFGSTSTFSCRYWVYPWKPCLVPGCVQWECVTLLMYL